VYWGGSDGVIHCNNTNSNTEEWHYVTGGKIFTAPTIANGCVYAGSSDGYAYCIEAHTGRLVWRFRGAPADRRISLYGHLSSTWPVLTGVMVQGTTAFFVAGFTPETGVHVYALDALTGSIVWQNNTAGISEGQRTGSSPGRYVSGLMTGGGMTIVGNRLWVRSYLNSNAVFDLATGARSPVPSALDGGMDIYLTVRGREIGALDATHAVFGGRPLFADNNERGAIAVAVGRGLGQLAGVRLPSGCGLATVLLEQE
jgi:outer membrane protein assembly factor BamB